MAQPSYTEIGLGFSFWHKSHSGVFSACAKYKCMCRMRRIDQRSSAEYISRSSKRLKAISNLSSVEAYEYKHTNVNAVDG